MKRSIAQNSEYSYPSHVVQGQGSDLIQLLVAFLIALMFYGFTDWYWETVIGVFIVSYSVIWYVESLGKSIAIVEVMLVIASFQWILGPIIAYHFGGENARYRMYVPEEVYMDYAVPAIIFFFIGIRSIRSRINLNAVSYYVKLGHVRKEHIFIVLFIGIFIDYSVPFVPHSLYFVIYILSQFKYIALLYFIVTKHPRRWLITLGIFSMSVISSAEEGLFHSLILWSALIFSYICLTVKFSRFNKLILFFVGLLLLMALQSVKAEYRELTRESVLSDEAKVTLLMDLLLGTTRNSSVRNNEITTQNLNPRLNQGWIISAVMNYVPKTVDFVYGETIIEAIEDSLIPRFLFHKKSARVSEKFQRFTGIKLNNSTSMGISILGEAYVNFGVFGGVIFMFIWGVVISLIMRYISVISRSHPTVVLWTPLIFLQMVKAETELVVVLNHGVKTAIAITLFYFVSRNIMGWKI